MSDGVSDRVRLKYAFTIREAYYSRDILYTHVHVETINVPLSRIRRKINVTDQHSRMRRCFATCYRICLKIVSRDEGHK